MKKAAHLDIAADRRRPGGDVRALPAGEGVSDASLVERARAGDRWAEEVIYRRYVGTIAGLAVRLLRSRSEMEDVVQETFAIALERLGSLRDGNALRGWLAQIAVGQVRRRFRRRRLLALLGLDRTEEDAPFESLAAEGITAEEAAELGAIDALLTTLPVEQRIAWVLRHVEGESLEDVARACSCSLATAKRRIAAAEARVNIHVRPT
ncbi:RNA polymerase sigma factor [Polyangium aurulentum]|uniref:RNA polymerase sigma factor n=1 Tax=Polyangium aurulentum TaxID=2567896 RepID=UPI00146D557A|nr:RNA polymerase sigma factor [Polyangium aurulentum]UQA58152.1 RNA polymerase sigma factor [Polyangium aurulentum]